MLFLLFLVKSCLFLVKILFKNLSKIFYVYFSDYYFLYDKQEFFFSNSIVNL